MRLKYSSFDFTGRIYPARVSNSALFELNWDDTFSAFSVGMKKRDKRVYCDFILSDRDKPW